MNYFILIVSILCKFYLDDYLAYMYNLWLNYVKCIHLKFVLDVSIPVLTPGAPPVVIPAGQDVLVLRTPKGVYLRLPDGRIIAVQLPPSLLAKTQFRPNVVTHFRPATPKGNNYIYLLVVLTFYFCYCSIVFMLIPDLLFLLFYL